MSGLFNLFINNILPILLAASAGYFLSRAINLDVKTVSQVVFYIFSPCLVFSLLTQNNLSNRDIFQVMLFAFCVISSVGVIAWIVGKLLKFERRTLAVVVLSSMIMNAGNYGLPVVLFAFGENALSYASVFFVVSASMAYTVGIFIASLGTTSVRMALTNLFRVPAIYGLLLALLILHTRWAIPLPVARTVKLLGDASVPGMLVLLGMQFKNFKLNHQIGPLSFATLMRLLISPAIALLLASLFGFAGAKRQAVILEAAMPSGVLNTMIATQYEVEPAFVTGVVFITTLLSPLTITPLLAFLGA